MTVVTLFLASSATSARAFVAAAVIVVTGAALVAGPELVTHWPQLRSRWSWRRDR